MHACLLLLDLRTSLVTKTSSSRYTCIRASHGEQDAEYIIGQIRNQETVSLHKIPLPSHYITKIFSRIHQCLIQNPLHHLFGWQNYWPFNFCPLNIPRTEPTKRELTRNCMEKLWNCQQKTGRLCPWLHTYTLMMSILKLSLPLYQVFTPIPGPNPNDSQQPHTSAKCAHQQKRNYTATSIQGPTPLPPLPAPTLTFWHCECTLSSATHFLHAPGPRSPAWSGMALAQTSAQPATQPKAVSDFHWGNFMRHGFNSSTVFSLSSEILLQGRPVQP